MDMNMYQAHPRPPYGYNPPGYHVNGEYRPHRRFMGGPYMNSPFSNLSHNHLDQPSYMDLPPPPFMGAGYGGMRPSMYGMRPSGYPRPSYDMEYDSTLYRPSSLMRPPYPYRGVMGRPPHMGIGMQYPRMGMHIPIKHPPLNVPGSYRGRRGFDPFSRRGSMGLGRGLLGGRRGAFMEPGWDGDQEWEDYDGYESDSDFDDGYGFGYADPLMMGGRMSGRGFGRSRSELPPF